MSAQTEIPGPPPAAPGARAATSAPAPQPPPVSRRRPRLLIAVGIAALLAAGAGAYLLLSRGDSGPDAGGRAAAAKSAPLNAFKVVLPKGWRSATKEELAQASGTPLAVVRREDGRGLVVIRRSGRIPKDLPAFTRDLDKQLEKRFDDFERQTAKVVKVRAGSAYNYLYVRKKEGSVQTITVVPAERGSFTLNGVASGGDAKVAREIGRVIASFDA